MSPREVFKFNEAPSQPRIHGSHRSACHRVSAEGVSRAERRHTGYEGDNSPAGGRSRDHQTQQQAAPGPTSLLGRPTRPWVTQRRRAVVSRCTRGLLGHKGGGGEGRDRAHCTCTSLHLSSPSRMDLKPYGFSHVSAQVAACLAACPQWAEGPRAWWDDSSSGAARPSHLAALILWCRDEPGFHGVDGQV